MKLFKNFFAIALFLLPMAAGATASADLSAFRYYRNVMPAISVPTVIEIPFAEGSFSIPSFAVYNQSVQAFEPYLLKTKELKNRIQVQVNNIIGNPYSIDDGDYGTYIEFPAVASSSRGEITFMFDRPVTASSLSFALDNNVALPQKISISAEVSGKNYIVLSPISPSGGFITFPKTASDIWHVTFDYIQPLRISEIKFNDISLAGNTSSGLRFLAQPGQSYQIYFDADRYIPYTTKESGNLSSDLDVVRYGAITDISNPQYRPADSDSDSVPNFADNCVSVTNSDQKDSNGNGLGDACEDYDRDGVLNAKDNCIDLPNSSQIDTDADKIGDVCDSLDNRVTERLPWLPWAGIGIAGIVVLVLFVMVVRHKPENQEKA